MIDSNFIKNSKFIAQYVSRETLDELNKYSLSILKKNKEINLISTSTEKSIKSRHIEDSAQIIDFIDKNDISICTDLGSGAGLPGIVIAILMKSKKPQFKVILYEKSYHKSNFLKEISKKFNLNTEINQKNIFDQKNLQTDIIISRAFKPLPIIFEIALKNFKKLSIEKKEVDNVNFYKIFIGPYYRQDYVIKLQETIEFLGLKDTEIVKYEN